MCVFNPTWLRFRVKQIDWEDKMEERERDINSRFSGLIA